ncbi:MAG: ribonuclease D [Acidobacteria bacterium]|nr:ribonuclease D [Acidobacteriota bacterium]
MKDDEFISGIEWRYIAEPSTLQEALDTLEGEPVVGLDTETYWDAGARRSHVALVQIAPSEGEVLVIDVLATGVEPLRPLLESGEVKMVAHNARFDEGVLRQEGINPLGFVDTLQMSRSALSLGSYSLASVTEHLFGVPLDKSYQKSNWRRRPLTRAQLLYAAADARVTLRVYAELRKIFDQRGVLEQAMRAAELKPPRNVGSSSPRRRKPPVPAIDLTLEEKRIVTRLKGWRLGRANSQRLPAYMVCSDRTLEHLARELPETLEALAAIYGLGQSKIESFGQELLEALREA